MRIPLQEASSAGSIVSQQRSDQWGDGAGSCEKYGAFAGASGAESEGDAAEER